MLFTIPYKWSRCPLKNIGWIFYSIRRGVRNLIRWFPVIWMDEDFDWAYLAGIMETKFRFMAEDAKTWNNVGSEKQRKELLECAELLARIIDDVGKNEEIMKAWQERLGYLISRKLRRWWD
jgi:hypothetical protein